MKNKLIATFAVVLTATLISAARAEDGDWPTWRGPALSGVAASGNPPVEWSEEKNVRWKAELPGLGSSSPVVWKDRVYLTTAIDTGKPGAPLEDERPEDQRTMNSEGGPPATIYAFVVMALDRATGAEVWRRTVREEQPHEGTHPTGTFASNSPVIDGDRIFVSFGSRGLYALDFDGEILWEQDLGDMQVRLGFGEGSSPAVDEGLVVLNWDHEGDSFIAALDGESGEERWRQPRDEQTSWTTPLIVEHGDRKQVIISATGKVRSYDLRTGELLWEVGGMTLNAIPSPVYADGVVYLTSGFRGNALLAVALEGASGDLEGGPNVLWSLDRDTPYVPSPLLYDGLLYVLKSNKGLLSVIDPEDGSVVYGVERLDNVRNVYASPVAAAGRVYFLGRDGGGTVLRHGRSLEVLADNQLDDGFDASPAIAGDEIFLRGRKNLYCIAE